MDIRMKNKHCGMGVYTTEVQTSIFYIPHQSIRASELQQNHLHNLPLGSGVPNRHGRADKSQPYFLDLPLFAASPRILFSGNVPDSTTTGHAFSRIPYGHMLGDCMLSLCSSLLPCLHCSSHCSEVSGK